MTAGAATSAVSDEHAQLCRRVTAELDALFAGDWRQRDLVAMQARLKLALMACAPFGQKQLGRLVAAGKALPPAELAAAYRDRVAAVIAVEPTRGRHVNALAHAFGYFRGSADVAERRRLHDCIEGYGRGEWSLASVRAEIAGAAERHALAYLQRQIYFA